MGDLMSREQAPRFLIGAMLALVIVAETLVSGFAREEQGPKSSLYVLLMDTSGSMAETPKDRSEPKIETVRRVLRDFVRWIPTGSYVIFSAFDAGIRTETEVMRVSEETREAFLELVNRAVPQGKETHAWTSLGQMLGRAKEWLDRNPGAQVRLFMYSDGEDTTKTDLKRILEPYRPLLAREEVDATCYTLGFEFKRQITADLEAIGVRLSPVPNVADLAPPMVAEMDWTPRAPFAGDPVAFRDKSSGWIDAHAWDFGDGAKSTEKGPEHSYPKAGSYTVRLRVTDSGGHNAEVARLIEVIAPADPVVDFFVNANEVRAGERIAFVERCLGSMHGFRWEFGDGEDAEGSEVTHQYAQAGTYQAALTAMASDGRVLRSAPKTISVSEPPAPIVTILLAPSPIEVGLTVPFIANVEGLYSTIQWSFGDGVTSTDLCTEHCYATAGAYDVVLEARGPGGEARSTRTVLVNAPRAPVAGFTIGATKPRAGEEIVFTNTSTGPMHTVHWSFGDGSSQTRTGVEAAAGGVARHAYTQRGDYTVTLEVEGPGGRDAHQETVVVSEHLSAPLASFEFAAPEEAPAEMTFRNRSSGGISRFVWDFGDGSAPQDIPDLRDMRHRYERPGSFLVRLTAHSTEGFPASVAEQAVVVPAPPNWFERNRLWLLLGAIAMIAAIIALLRWISAVVREQRLAYLSGRLEIRHENRWHIVGQVTKEAKKEELVVPLSALSPFLGNDAKECILRRAQEGYELVPKDVASRPIILKSAERGSFAARVQNHEFRFFETENS